MENQKVSLFMTAHGASGQKFASSERHDPLRNFNYRVTISGKKNFARAGFQKVTGLKIKTDVIEYRDGDDEQLNPHKLAGLVKSDPITLERGMSEDVDMWSWIVQQIKSNDDGHKCTVKIELLDRARNGARAWELRECWISDYETGDFDAQGNGIALDRMVIQHEGIKLLNGSYKGQVSGTVE